MPVFPLFPVVGLAAMLLAASPNPVPAAPSRPCGLPPSWSLSAMANAVPSLEGKSRLTVLAWKIIEDDRPLRVESALVLKEFENPKRYFLAHLYRRPDEPKEGWNLAMTHVSGAKGSAAFPGLMITHLTRFDAKPGNREIYAALGPEVVSWTFATEKGWKLLASGVCAESWQEALGEKPTRFFPQLAAVPGSRKP